MVSGVTGLASLSSSPAAPVLGALSTITGVATWQLDRIDSGRDLIADGLVSMEVLAEI
jgi:hypothetical protein